MTASIRFGLLSEHPDQRYSVEFFSDGSMVLHYDDRHSLASFTLPPASAKDFRRAIDICEGAAQPNENINAHNGPIEPGSAK